MTLEAIASGAAAFLIVFLLVTYVLQPSAPRRDRSIEPPPPDVPPSRLLAALRASQETADLQRESSRADVRRLRAYLAAACLSHPDRQLRVKTVDFDNLQGCDRDIVFGEHYDTATGDRILTVQDPRPDA
jgi:hypothetical protein